MNLLNKYLIPDLSNIVFGYYHNFRNGVDVLNLYLIPDLSKIIFTYYFRSYENRIYLRGLHPLNRTSFLSEGQEEVYMKRGLLRQNLMGKRIGMPITVKSPDLPIYSVFRSDS